MSNPTANLTIAELITATRGHPIDLRLVEAADRTRHLSSCPRVLDRAGRPVPIPLESVRVLRCYWCQRQLTTPSLATVVRLPADIATLSEHAEHPSAAWAVALDTLTQIHEGVVADFPPPLDAFASNQHRLNHCALRRLHASLGSDSPAGESLRHSALRIALYEAVAAAVLGDVALEGALRPIAEDILARAPADHSQLGPVMLTLAEWEAVRTVARPRGHDEWQLVNNPPLNPSRHLVQLTQLSPKSLEALAAELLIEDLLEHLASLDMASLETTPTVRIRIENGPHLTPPARALIWRRGRIHWLRGLIDVGLVGEVEDDRSGSRTVSVPFVVGAALRLPGRLAGVSPVVAAPHHLVDQRAMRLNG